MGGDDSEADTRLIAAAPDLLDVARRVADYFEHTNAPLTVLDAIVEQLDGKTWSSDTLDNIAGILRDAGYAVRDEFFAGEPQA
jgi:hypothetical protein